MGIFQKIDWTGIPPHFSLLVMGGNGNERRTGWHISREQGKTGSFGQGLLVAGA